MSVAAYPEYRESGVEWIGAVPAGWKVLRLADLFREVAEEGEDGLPVLSVSIHDGVSDRELADEDMDRKVTRSEDRSKYKRVAPGDLVYNMMRAWQGGFGTVTVIGMVSPAYVVARPKAQFRTELVEHLLRTPRAVEEMRRYSRGVTDFRLRLYWEEFKTIRVPMSSPAEQSAIVAFLNRETGKIDALVAEQERLMALLKEKRQAVISQAVTKGLNPNVPMKDSGVEWLGEVPAHWTIKKLKRLLSAALMYGANEVADDDTPGNPRFVRITDVNADGGLQDDTFRSLPPEVASPYILAEGDILLARSGATVGKSFRYRRSWGECCFAGYLIRARFDPKTMIAPFADYFFSSRAYWANVESDQVQSTIPNFSAERYAGIVMATPPLREQYDIITFLDGETGRIDTLTTEAAHAIALLKERRAALISSAVTGKIDVRGLVSAEAEAA